MNKAINNIRNKKGFTLIELLIVVAIIGILAAIAIPGYMDFSIKAKISGIDQNIGAVKDALTIFRSENGAWPTAVAQGDGIALNTAIGSAIANQYGETYQLAATSATVTTLTVIVQGVDAAVNADTMIAVGTAASGVVTWDFDNGTLAAKYTGLY